jgi:hypothetical protein
MTDETIDNVEGNTGFAVTDSTLTDSWYDEIAGDNAGRKEMLSQHESMDAFLDAHHAAISKDWRKDIAGDDDKFMSKLQRFSDPGAFGNAYREAEQKIRAGDIGPQAPGEDATEEQIREYRTQIGVPLEVDGYLKDLPEGLVVGDEDREVMLDFLGGLHNLNAPPAVAHQAIAWYNKFAETQQAVTAELDAEQREEADNVLRQDWGNDYTTNKNLVEGMLSKHFGQEAKEQLLNGRYMDGRGFFNDPNVMKGLAEIARMVNPGGHILPNDQTQMQSLNDEIASLEKYMKEKRTEYNRDVQAQERLRELYDIRLKMQDQDAA